MRMIHTYSDFCSYYEKRLVYPDVRSHLGWRSVQYLRKHGWKIGKWRTARDLLAICRQSPQNFELAYRHAGIDFWVD